jgi:lysozyme
VVFNCLKQKKNGTKSRANGGKMSPNSKARLIEQIKIDEGIVEEIYVCPLGHLTFGVGHLILESDPEHGQPAGTPISKERIDEALANDVEITIAECQALYDNWENLPSEVQEILANLMFNIGRTRLSGFKNLNAAVAAGDWKTAAAEMVDSRWYQQVGNRATRLVARMETVGI